MMRRLLRPLAILGALTRFGILASAAPVLAAAEGKSDAELRALSTLVRELVPHPVDEAVFQDAAVAIRGAMPMTAEQIDDALRRLRADAPGDLPVSDPFLAQLRTAAVEALYRDPRVWNLIGYGGNALAKGGYVATFNDIDWLPGERR